MREIKFRVWLYPPQPKDDFGRDWVGTMREPISILPNEVTDVYFGDVIMQSTGLKDRENTEIYEGDIVKYLGPTKKGRIFIYQVIWQPEKCRFIGRHLLDPKNLKPIRMFAAGYQVIGNIYENPELLP